MGFGIAFGRKVSPTYSGGFGHYRQGLSQDSETGCLKLAIVKFWGVQIIKGGYNILRFQP